MGEKKKVFQCTVCGRIHSRAEGKCPCGADLAIFGKWMDDPEETIQPDPIPPKPDPTTPGPDPVPPKPDPTVPKPEPVLPPPKPKPRIGIFVKIVCVLAGVFLLVLISAFARAVLDISEKDSSEPAEKTAEQTAEDDGGDTEPTPTETPDPTASATPTEAADEKGIITISNGTEKIFFNVFLFPDSADKGSDLQGADLVQVSGEEITASIPFREEKNCYIIVVMEDGNILEFFDVFLVHNDHITISETVNGGSIDIMRDGRQSTVYGEKRSYTEAFEYTRLRLISFLNGSNYEFTEIYIYESDAKTIGDNLAELKLKDGKWSPYDVLKFNTDSTKTKDIYLIDSEGNGWLYENVNLSRVFCLDNDLDEEGNPELLLIRSGEDVEIISGVFYQDQDDETT